MTKQPSERQHLAQRIADKINELGINNPFGGDVNFMKAERGGGWYEVSFSIPVILDGTIRVFTTSNVGIETNRNEFRGLNEKEVMLFLTEPINGGELIAYQERRKMYRDDPYYNEDGTEKRD